MTLNETTPASAAYTRVRHPFKARHLQLLSREQISPGFLRLTLVGELRDFVSDGFDDHFKLILPSEGADKPALPEVVDGKPVFEGPRPTLRDYTPLRWSTNTLTVDFALHDSGPATQWARTAPMGSWVGVAGPRGSMVIRADLPWYVLLADATGLPAVERALAHMPASAAVTVRLAVSAPDQRPLHSPAQVDLQWVDSLPEAAQALTWPAGEGFVWAAGEHHDMAAVRHIVTAQGVPLQRTRISAYWKRGAPGHHEALSNTP